MSRRSYWDYTVLYSTTPGLAECSVERLRRAVLLGDVREGDCLFVVTSECASHIRADWMFVCSRNHRRVVLLDSHDQKFSSGLKLPSGQLACDLPPSLPFGQEVQWRRNRYFPNCRATVYRDPSECAAQHGITMDTLSRWFPGGLAPCPVERPTLTPTPPLA